MDITGMDVPDALRPVFEGMEAAEVAQLTIKDLGDLGLAAPTALRLFNASRKQVKAVEQEAEAVAADQEDDPVATLLRRLAAAPKPSARLAQAAEQIDPRPWLVLNAAGKVLPEASQAELKRLRRGLPNRGVTTDGNRVLTPSAWAARTAETVLLHPWRGTPLEDDGTDPHTGVSWAEETLWLRAAVARPEAGLAESAIAAQLAEPTTPWALAARARVEALDDDERSDLLRGRKRRVDAVPPVVTPVVEPTVVPVPKVERYGAAVAPWAASGTAYARMGALFLLAFKPAELETLIRGIPGGTLLANAVAWEKPAADVMGPAADAVLRYGMVSDVLDAVLKVRRHLEPEIRAIAKFCGDPLLP